MNEFDAHKALQKIRRRNKIIKMIQLGKGLASIGICTAVAIAFYQSKDTDVLWWLFLVLLLFS